MRRLKQRMSKPTYQILVNPNAGRGSGAPAEAIVREVFAQAGVRFDLIRTAGPGDATRLAYRAVLDGYDVIVAVGGDGTAHEAIQGMIQVAQERGAWANDEPIGTLGLVPIGTGNDYGWRLGLPENSPQAASRLVLGDHRRVIDLGQVTDEQGYTRFFHNHLGAGFEAATLIESFKIQRLRGLMLYLLAILRTIPKYRQGPTVTARYNGIVQTRPLLLASVANGGRTGGGFRIAPDAELDDGQLDLVMGQSPNPAVTLWVLMHAMRGTHVSLTRYISVARTPDITLEIPMGIPVHLDGELYRTDARRLDITILPKRLRVIAALPPG